MDKETIRQAIVKNRGGLETANDEQIKIIWDSLSAETQKQYLKTIDSATENTENTETTAKEN